MICSLQQASELNLQSHSHSWEGSYNFCIVFLIANIFWGSYCILFDTDSVANVEDLQYYYFYW